MGAFIGLPQLIRQLGGEPEQLLGAAGLDRRTFSHAENRVSYAAFVDLLGRAAESTQCRHLGLLAGRMATLSQLGVVGELVRHSNTVGRALTALTSHQHVNSEGGLAFLLRRGEFVDLGYAMYPAAMPGAEQMHDAVLACAMNLMTELCGPTWRPYEVRFSHAKPTDVEQYRAFFKVLPRFDEEFCALRFPVGDLARPLPQANAAAYQRARRRARAAVPPDFLQKVYRGVRLLMLENRHSGDDLAQLLSMHRRTLNRRLQAEGVTFQRVLDDVRFDVARDLLANSNVRLDDIAATLGYSAITPFVRTFRRWSATTPGRWRRAARAD